MAKYFYPACGAIWDADEPLNCEDCLREDAVIVAGMPDPDPPDAYTEIPF